jgi:hypothetical protein
MLKVRLASVELNIGFAIAATVQSRRNDLVPLGFGAYAEDYDSKIAEQIRGVHDAFIGHHGIEQRCVPSTIGRFGLHHLKQDGFHSGVLYQGH